MPEPADKMPEPADKRASPRIRHRTTMSVVLNGCPDPHPAQVHDYSEDGLYFVTSEAYQPGDQLRLSMDDYDPRRKAPRPSNPMWQR